MPEDGAMVHGLFTDAWKWDDENMCMTESDYGVMNTSLPVFHMLPEMDFTPPKVDYICPLYKEGLRAGTLSTTGKNRIYDSHLVTKDRCFYDCFFNLLQVTRRTLLFQCTCRQGSHQLTGLPVAPLFFASWPTKIVYDYIFLNMQIYIWYKFYCIFMQENSG